MPYTHGFTGKAELTEAQWNLVSGLTLGLDHSRVFLDFPLRTGDRTMFFLTQQLAEQALSRYLKAMRTLMAQEQRDGFAVVIADPDGRILLVHVEGNPQEWQHPYLSIALSKCRMAMENQRNTRGLPAVSIRRGDTPYFGGVWMGLAIAVSGFSDKEDEELGGEIGYALAMLAEEKRKLWEKEHPNAHFYE